MVLSPYKNAFTNIFSKVIDLRRREDSKRKSDDQDEEGLVPTRPQPKKQKPNPPCRQCQAGLPGHISHLMSWGEGGEEVFVEKY